MHKMLRFVWKFRRHCRDYHDGYCILQSTCFLLFSLFILRTLKVKKNHHFHAYLSCSVGSEPCLLEAKPTSYTLYLVRLNFRLLFKILSAGIRWPRYSEVGCIYLNSFCYFLVKRLMSTELMNLEWEKVQKRVSILHLRNIGVFKDGLIYQ